MTTKKYGAISELRRLYNMEVPRDNVILGIREREKYMMRIEQATNEKNRLADAIKEESKASKLKAGMSALNSLSEKKKKSERKQNS